MEVSLIALLALGKTHRSQAAFVPEPDKFQPLDQQALRQLYRAKDESPTIAEPYPAQQAARLSAVYPPPVPFNSQIFWRSVRFLKKSQ
jgi:hypothetical protein